MKTLYVIPARKGSKGIPGKNSRSLGGKPLVQYSIETALSIASPFDICVTTDSEEVISIAEDCGLEIPFIRKAELSTDTANSRDVILDALDHYSNSGVNYDTVILLQPTSPFRKKSDILEMLDLYDQHTNMVVSVSVGHANPYYSLFEESIEGFLHLSKPSQFTRRQDCPPVYEYNGSVYIIRTEALKNKPLSSFEQVRKYVMSPLLSVDLDTPLDWEIAEMILEKKLLSQEE